MKRESVYAGLEKRRWPRFDLKFAKEKVTVRIEREGKVAINVRVKNISYGGLCFESYRRENFNYPMKIELSSKSPAQIIRAKASFVRERPIPHSFRKEVGIAIDLPEDIDLMSINNFFKFVDEIKASLS